MGLSLGRRLGIDSGIGGGIPFKSDLAMRASSRNDLNMIDELGNNSPILTSYLYKASTILYTYANDGGALGAGVGDLTLYCWFKGESNSVATTCYIAGKPVTGSVNGKYYFYVGTDGTFRMSAQPSGGIKTITSTVNARDLAWHLLMMDINQTTKIIRFFIDNVQIGSDTAFTGTFANLGDNYPFCIGIGRTADGTAFTLPSLASYSDTGVIGSVLSEAQRTSLFNRTLDVAHLAYYPLLGSSGDYEWDASGNNYHLNIVGQENATDRKLFYRYSASGSRWGLNKGYTLYSNGQGFSYIPYKSDGTPLTDPPIPTGSTKVSEHVGNTVKHNLSNSLIVINNVHWDRSNTTIWSDAARSSETFYDAANPTAWHPSELNNLRFNAWANTNYKGIGFVKVTDHSYKSRLVLDEIITYTNDHYSSGYASIISSYCKDYNPTDGIYENDYCYWRYDSQRILAVRANKILKYTVGYIHLSIDGGLTYPYSKAVTGFNGGCFGAIFANGNITFADRYKIYTSTDNLTNVTEIIPTGIDGNPYTATIDSYYDVNGSEYTEVDGVEVRVWGTYSNTAPTEIDNINVWLTDDSGLTIKSIFKFGVTLPTYAASHIHSITQDPSDESFIMNTGDGQYTCNLYRLNYNVTTKEAIWTHLVGKDGTIVSNAFCDSPYKTGGLGFYNNYIYWHSDGNDNRIFGTYRCLESEITDNTKGVRIYPTLLQIGCALWQRNGRAIISDGQPNRIHHTSDSAATIKTSNLYGLPENIGVLMTHPENTDGWFVSHVMLPTENDYVYSSGGVVWIKLK